MRGRNEHQVKNRLIILLKSRDDTECPKSENDIFTSPTADNTPFSRDQEAKSGASGKDSFSSCVDRIWNLEESSSTALPMETEDPGDIDTDVFFA
jgi:hypothetical protein